MRKLLRTWRHWDSLYWLEIIRVANRESKISFPAYSTKSAEVWVNLALVMSAGAWGSVFVAGVLIEDEWKWDSCHSWREWLSLLEHWRQAMFQSLMLGSDCWYEHSIDFILDDTFWVVLSSIFLYYVVPRLFTHLYPWQWKKLFYLFDSALELRFVFYSKTVNLLRSVCGRSIQSFCFF